MKPGERDHILRRILSSTRRTAQLCDWRCPFNVLVMLKGGLHDEKYLHYVDHNDD